MFPFNELVGELALKAIAFDYSLGTFVSPSVSEFHWSPDGLVAANCKTCLTSDIVPEGTEISNDVPGDNCRCGIYTTFRWDIVNAYIHKSVVSPVLLLEAAGKTILYTDGFRSRQGLVRASIQIDGTGMARMIAAQAADYFRVPVISKATATTAMDIWNWYKNPWYLPNDKILINLGREKSIERLSQYLNVNPKGEMVWQESPQ